MKERSPIRERALAGAFVFFVASSTLYFGSVNEADNDLWMHLFVGRWIAESGSIPRTDFLSYTAAGLPWIDHEWLAQWLAFELFAHLGSPALLAAKQLLVAALVWVLWVSHVRRRGAQRGPVDDALGANGTSQPPAWIWGPALVLILAAAARGLSLRPQLWSYVLIPLLLWLLSGVRLAWFLRLAATAALFVVWVNVHGGFLLGLATLALFTAWGLVLGRKEFAARLGLLVTAVIAALCNPYGWKLFPYLVDELSRSHPISEWQPVVWSEFEHGAFLLLVASWLATLPWARGLRERGWLWILAALTAYFAVRHQRHVPVFALCVAGPLLQQWTAAAEWLRARSWTFSAAGKWIIAGSVVALSAFQLLWVIQVRLRGDRAQIVFAEQEYPVRVVAALREAGIRLNLAVPLDWGGYALWHLAPRIKLSLDGRFATVFPERVVEDNFAFYRGGPGWSRLVDSYPTEAVLIAASARHPLRTAPEWVEVAADGVASLYVRRSVVDRFPAQFALPAAPPPLRSGWLAFP